MPVKKESSVISRRPSAKKPVAKAVVKAQVVNVEKKAESRKLNADSSLSVPVYSLSGKSNSEAALPKEIFGAEVNKTLLSQALRVYMNNQKGHFSNTKTRGEVQGSTKKIYKQKGTGGARHGAKRAPIFVGGGIALGPKTRNVELKLPQKMKSAALISAFSQKAKDSQVSMVADLEKSSGKTKEMVKFVKAMNSKSLLVVTDLGSEKIALAARALKNIQGTEMISASAVNALDVLKSQNIVINQAGIEMLQKRLMGDKNA